MTIVAFVGSVGAGKTTHINMLYSYLKMQRIKVIKTVLKINVLLTHIFLIVLCKIYGLDISKRYPIRALIDDRKDVLISVLDLWLFIDIVSIIIKFFIRIYIPHKLGYIVLVEDFLIATIVDYNYLARELNISDKYFNKNIRLARYLLSLITDDMFVFFLDADLNILKDRWSKRGSPIEVDSYIYIQKNDLLRFASSFPNYIYINTSNYSVEEVHKCIIQKLRVNYGKGMEA